MSETFSFTKAQKFGSKARVAIAGPSGSGKTFTALGLAVTLGMKVVDTEGRQTGPGSVEK